MSCTICRLPFTPAPMGASPLGKQLPPAGFMSDANFRYFSKAVGIGARIMEGISDFTFSSGNLFSGGSMIFRVAVAWEGAENGSAWMMHTGCAKIFQSVFGLEKKDDVNELADLFQVEKLLGPLMHGGHSHGRFVGVDYESAGERVDTRSYWGRTSDDYVTFDYKTAIKDNMDWLFTRPDVFPKFPRVVDKSKRVQHLGEPEPDSDIVTKQPPDVIHTLIRHMDPATYLSFVSTCKYLRYHSITTFQPYARDLLLKYYPWAFPTNLEYEVMSQKKSMRDLFASKDLNVCGPQGDWLLYMCQVHWTKSMRVRRYVWAVCEEAKRVYEEKLDGNAAYDRGDEEGNGKGPGRSAVEECARGMTMMGNLVDFSKPLRGPRPTEESMKGMRFFKA